MKLTFRNAFLLTTILGLLLFSCKKQSSEPEQEPISTDPAAIQKVVAWLDARQQKYNDSASRQTIASLKENLVGSQIRTEVLNDKQKIIIVPLKNEFVTSNVTSQLSFKNLVITEGEDHELTLGSIVEIIPKDQHFNKVPADLISKVLNNKDNELNGTFSILSLANKFIAEKEYRNGKLSSIKHLSQKEEKPEGEKGTASQKINATCIAWYLVETTYYSDGSYTETWTYLYTDCQGDCQTTRMMDSRTPFRIECGGGGGSQSQETIEEISFSAEEAQYDDADSYNVGGYSPIVYNFHATVTRVNGEVVNVIMYPVTASPAVGFYVDRYGRNVTRTITLFSQMNSYTLLSASSVLLNWSCAVIGVYTFTDSTPTWTRQWYVSKSKVD